MGTTAEVLEKLRGLDGPTLLALVDAFPNGKAGVNAVLRGELKISLNQVLRLLADATGLCISKSLDLSDILLRQICNENKTFRVEQPDINYHDILSWYKEIFPKGTDFLEVSEFEDLAESSREKILQDHQISNLFKRAHMPIPFPKYQVNDIGTALQKFYLPAVKKSYKLKCSRGVNNWKDGKLVKQVTTLPNLGSEIAIAKSGMFWFFSHPLQGFSVNAQRGAMKVLTQHGLGLSGNIANSLAIAGFPLELVGSYQTPGMFCSGDFWESSGYSLYFKANDVRLNFVDTDALSFPDDNSSGGLFFLG